MTSGKLSKHDIDEINKQDVIITILEMTDPDCEEMKPQDAEAVYKYFHEKGIDWLMNEFLLYAKDSGDIDHSRLLSISEEV